MLVACWFKPWFGGIWFSCKDTALPFAVVLMEKLTSMKRPNSSNINYIIWCISFIRCWRFFLDFCHNCNTICVGRSCIRKWKYLHIVSFVEHVIVSLCARDFAWYHVTMIFVTLIIFTTATVTLSVRFKQINAVPGIHVTQNEVYPCAKHLNKWNISMYLFAFNACLCHRQKH